MKWFRISAIAVLAAAVAIGSSRQVEASPLTGVSVNAGQQTVASPDGKLVVVMRRPPVPRREVQSKRPTSRHVWVGGHWRYGRGRFVWVPGRWVIPPHRGAVYVRPVWVRHGAGYVVVRGGWR